MADTKFMSGKYEGKTWEYVRVNHPDYFAWMYNQPVYIVRRYLGFIAYCLSFKEDGGKKEIVENEEVTESIFTSIGKFFNL